MSRDDFIKFSIPFNIAGEYQSSGSGLLAVSRTSTAARTPKGMLVGYAGSRTCRRALAAIAQRKKRSARGGSL